VVRGTVRERSVHAPPTAIKTNAATATACQTVGHRRNTPALLRTGRRGRRNQLARNRESSLVIGRCQIVALEPGAFVRCEAIVEVIVDQIVLSDPYAIERLAAREVLLLERSARLLVQFAQEVSPEFTRVTGTHESSSDVSDTPVTCRRAASRPRASAAATHALVHRSSR